MRRGRFEWYRHVSVRIVNGNESISIGFSNIDPLGHSFLTTDENRMWLIENLLDRFLN